MTSVPGNDADQTPTAGHTIERSTGRSSRRTCGRTVAKSVKSFGIDLCEELRAAGLDQRAHSH
jgi:hypothetical protein